MRVLIISSNREVHPWPVLPLGASYVASGLREAGHDVEFLDLCWSDASKSIPRIMESFSPELIGISVRNIDNVDLYDSRFYLEEIRRDVMGTIRNGWNTPVVVGGSAVSIMPERIMEFLGADYAIIGEGELSTLQLVDRLESDGDFSTVDGLCYRKDHRIIRNPIRPVADINSLAHPVTYHWVDWKRYAGMYTPYPVQTKRGCALRCSYCVYNAIEGRSYRLREPSSVADEIEDILESCSPKVIEFTDSTFNIPLEHALAICRELASRKLHVSYNTMGINPGKVTGELVELLGRAGFMEVSCTPESGSERMLRNLGKNFDTNQVARTASLLEGAGIPVVWYFLFGGPGESEDTVRETFDFIERNISDRDLVFITTGIRILPGSPLHSGLLSSGELRDQDLLFPIWYRPGDIEMQRLKYLIDREVIMHANYINLQDNTDESLLARMMKRLYSRFGVGEPIWTNIIRRNTLRRVLLLNRYRLWKLKRERAEEV